MVNAKEFFTSIRFLVKTIDILEIPTCLQNGGLMLSHKKVKLNCAAGGFFEGIIHSGIAQLLSNQTGWITIWFSKYNEHLEIQTFEFDHNKATISSL
jgi:hypothetical protein